VLSIGWSKVRPDAVTRIDLETPRLSLTVEREGDAWRVTRPLVDRAEATTMRGLLSALEMLTPEAVVSTNPERYARYGVDSTGKALTVHMDGDETHLVIGKLSPDAQSVYLRYEDDPRVLWRGAARRSPPTSTPGGTSRSSTSARRPSCAGCAWRRKTRRTR